MASRSEAPVSASDASPSTKGESPSPTEVQTPPQKTYIITNDFQDHKSSGRLYLRLKSSQSGGASYIVPPAEFGNVNTGLALVGGFKVNTGCVSVEESQFPLWVDVCQSADCLMVRRTGYIENPGHYSVSGIGSLMILQIYSHSPCSEEFSEQIRYVGEYSSADELFP